MDSLRPLGLAQRRHARNAVLLSGVIGALLGMALLAALLAYGPPPQSMPAHRPAQWRCA